MLTFTVSLSKFLRLSQGIPFYFSFCNVETGLASTGMPAGMEPLKRLGFTTFLIFLQLRANLSVL